MTSYKKSQEEFSRDVYEAFQAIGVTSDMIYRRRHDRLLEVTVNTTGAKLLGYPVSYFIVGSQVEGSTTMGMRSDTDHVYRQDNYQVVLELGAWQKGKFNLLAFKDETTPPQFYKLCRLQPTQDGRQEYMRCPAHETDVVDEQGRVLASNVFEDNVFKYTLKKMGINRFVRHGPSRSWTDKLDFVNAFPCNDLPEECECLFTRSHPNNWPKPETIEYARHCQVFFIPQGHPHSPLNERNLQWRLSTSLAERKLMFDFTDEQMLVFILLKMLKKEYCKQTLCDKFSTFHIKTAMMFSIEKHPPGIWRIDNIVACATLCIDLLIQWAQDHVCPHFTMSGVNLFDGKLSKQDIKELETFLTDLKKNIAEKICNLKMDFFGVNVLQKEHDKESKIKQQTEIFKEITCSLRPVLCRTFNQLDSQMNSMGVRMAYCCVSNHLTYLRGLQSHGSDLQRESAELLLPFLCGTLASIKASLCIIAKQTVSQDIIKLYKTSFEWNLMNGKLKYASMLFCSGQYDQAADMFNHCESLLGPDVERFCGCYGRHYHYQSVPFFRKCPHTSTVDLLKTSSTSCVLFCKHELPCVPEHLQYEMYRTQTQQDKNERRPQHAWMDMIVIDCVPFLYYLQYLVYRQKGNLPRRHSAMSNLMDCNHHGLGKQLCDNACGHMDTTFHMLAHCWELENRPKLAWQLYQRSINSYPTQNIAWVHLIRLFREYFLRET